MTQMLLDLQKVNARVAVLEGENAQLKVDLSTVDVEISKLKERMLHEQLVHNNRIDKLLSLMEKNTTPPS